MCKGCYEEMESPEPDDVAMSLVPLIAAVYEESCVGGNFHVTLDDFNVDVRTAWRGVDGKCDISEAEKNLENAIKPEIVSDDQLAAALAVFHGYCET